MSNRAALLVVVLAFALPAIADEPPKLVQKNVHPLAPKNTVPKSPKNLNGPKSGLNANQKPGEHTSLVFGKENVTNLSGSSQGTKHKHKSTNNGTVGGPISSGFNIQGGAPAPK